MTNLLRKLFIKNYKNIEDPKIREKHGVLASFVGVFTNLLLFAFKLLIGIITVSISIISDAINNLTDMASCLVNLFGFKIAGKPADKEHPFGHERIEYIAGLIISLVIIAIAGVLAYSSVEKVINNEPSNPNVWTFVILGAAILVKVWQGVFYGKISKAINSVSLKASSQDSFNDVISTSVVLVSAFIQFILSINGIVIPFSLDGVLGIAVSVFIIVMGIKLVVETANPLIGITPDNELVKKIVDDILSYDGVLGIHDLMCHSYGPTKIFMTIHVEVDSSVDVLLSHDLIDNIEHEVSSKNNVFLTIHMDPIVTNSPEVEAVKSRLKEAIKNIDESINFHDLRTVEGPTHTNVLFDIVVPFGIKKKDEEIVSEIQSSFKGLDKQYNLIINVDRDYVNYSKE